MIRRSQRFRHYLDDNLIRLHKNLFISPSDPQYYEKVIRYLDARSPEAHYNLGQNFRIKGNRKRALFHYKEALKTYPSPYYSAANRAVYEMNQEEAAATTALQHAGAIGDEKRKPLLPPLMKALLITLLVLNLILCALYFIDSPVKKVISSLKVWPVGAEVTYETVDKPYIMYFPPQVKQEEMEAALQKQAVALTKDDPEQNVVLYGLLSSDARDQGKTLLLTNEELIKSAVVTAQYHPGSDRTVKIRFLNSQLNQHQPLSAIGANLVRTALAAYHKEYDVYPGSVEALVQDYPQNFLSFIPVEPNSSSNVIHLAEDDSGGWVYDPFADGLDHIFYPNVSGGSEMPYEPFYINVDKQAHNLKFISGDRLLYQAAIGLGANDSTPEGDFYVQDRVIKPQGRHPNVFGDAGLGLGNIALHGTNERDSIGEDRSLGCVRLSNEDVGQLYTFVPKGMEVHIGSATRLAKGLTPVADMQELIPAEQPAIVQTPAHQIFNWLG
ncbi:L,D-transpeptidase family protein [Paenibacillus aestuarii]|uniref:L,D-transpeptidase family protein n=1 Tax=Paenibacillus aestuarii TaxID=516965 RepID=A0ABW0KHS3_9BACL|nr:L,D-transpeptidase family protein [Paenibacillus aestuarii]